MDTSWLDLLRALSRDHLVTTADARRAGLGPAELRTLLRRRRIQRVIRGWYAVPPADDAKPPWEDTDPFEAARQRHRLLTRALVRSYSGRAVASHYSALVLFGISVWRSDLTVAHLCRATDEASRHRAGAVLHPACGVAPVDGPGGYLTVPVPVAVVQAGLVLQRHGGREPVESLVAADSALHLGLASHEDLDSAVALFESHPGIVPVRALLQTVDGRHESVGETRLFHLLRVLGYDIEPQVQLTVGSRRYRVDGRVRGHNVMIEFDGMTKYLPGPGIGDDLLTARRALGAEKSRQQDITLATGAVFARFTWSDLDSAAIVDQRMRAAIALARRRTG